MSYNSSPSTAWFGPPMLLLLFACIPIALLYRSYLKLTFHASFGLLVTAFALGVWATNDRIGMLKLQGEWRSSGMDFKDEVLIPGSCLLFYVFAVAFVVRLCRAWFFDDLREGEELAGGEGARVWLSGGNLVCAIAITLFGADGFGYSPFALGLITFLAIVARPLLAAGAAAGPAIVAASSDPQRAASEGERERVLRLLEEGKVDADGAADLLNALGAAGASAPAAVSRPPMSSRQRLAMAGGALVLVGFLLPWFSVNLGKEMSRMGGVLTAEIGNLMPELPATKMQMPIPKIKTGTVRVSGADVGKGLGWIVLVGGLLSAGLAALPQLVADAALRRNLAIGALFVGGATLFYVFGSSMRHVSYGIVAVVAGYFCIGVGLAESWRRGA